MHVAKSHRTNLGYAKEMSKQHFVLGRHFTNNGCVPLCFMARGRATGLRSWPAAELLTGTSPPSGMRYHQIAYKYLHHANFPHHRRVERVLDVCIYS